MARRRMLTPLSRRDREHAVARLREGLRDSDTTVQRTCIEGVVAWRDRDAVPLLEQLIQPRSGTYDVRAAIGDAARLAQPNFSAGDRCERRAGAVDTCRTRSCGSR